MFMNDRITHTDLINLGIVFLEQPEEGTFLKRINDDFAYMVGQEALNWIKDNNNKSRDFALGDVWKLFEEDQDKCSEIVEKVRARILVSLSERRKHLLGKSSKR